MECIWNKKSVKRGTALVMAAVLLALAVPFPPGQGLQRMAPEGNGSVLLSGRRKGMEAGGPV